VYVPGGRAAGAASSGALSRVLLACLEGRGARLHGRRDSLQEELVCPRTTTRRPFANDAPGTGGARAPPEVGASRRACGQGRGTRSAVRLPRVQVWCGACRVGVAWLASALCLASPTARERRSCLQRAVVLRVRWWWWWRGCGAYVYVVVWAVGVGRNGA